ncbi:MAG: hypothetical protein M1823_004410 [Watsoniomyces obsoletus]|nr:MAG: hypothetical protein M1823_004410 [Watsoniomyces obsoletus]
MASHAQPSPPTALHPSHHGPPTGPPGPVSAVHATQVNGQMQPETAATASSAAPPAPKSAAQHLAAINEAVWLQIGSLTELMGDLDGAIQAYEHALRHNWRSIPAMNAISSIMRAKEHFPKAVEYLQNILKIDGTNGEVWGSLGHCYLMMDDLTQAYNAYQQAVFYLRDTKDPKLWYGIGVLYDRHGSLDLAEEAFSTTLRVCADFEKANEVYFRLGIIYKQQAKYQQSLECFRYIINDPPRPLTEEDIWFQIGHVHEQQKDYDSAKGAYRRVLDRDPNHAKVLQQLGWLHHQQSNSYTSQEQAIEYLEKSVASDQSDAQSWYLLGRCYMSQQKYPKAYEAYQQAVYRDGRNSTFWCSIGVLYYQINQFRDALDAYSRAIRLNPYISEVWYDLGTLYESCNNQISDAMDAYTRAAELDPSNVHIRARLQLLRNGGRATGMPNQNSTPLPQDVHPQAYQDAGVGGPPRPQWGAPAPTHPPNPAPHHAPPSGSWNPRLAEIQHPLPPPPHPYDKESVRPPPPAALPGPPRPPSPRTDPMRHYGEPPRPAPGPSNAPPPARRPMSPSPRVTHAAPGYPPPPTSLPHAGPPPPPQAPSQPPPAPTRIANPNYGAPTPSLLPPASHGANGVGGAPGSMPPYGRGHSPPPEVRPIVDDRAQSPHSRPMYASHPASMAPSQAHGIATGAPTPESAQVAAEAAARERHDRTPSMTIKRRGDWPDDNGPAKKAASEENRMAMEDQHHRRPSPANKLPSPHEFHRRSPSDLRRGEDVPRPLMEDSGVHHHHAPHHPPEPQPHPHALPPISSTYGPMAPKEEPSRREEQEPAARKMDVDEDYDDEPESKAGPSGHERPSPPGRTNSVQGSILNGVNKAEG